LALDAAPAKTTHAQNTSARRRTSLFSDMSSSSGVGSVNRY
jgi:hypothetical protein